MERNSVRASDARVLLAPKVIAAVIGIIGIALLTFADPAQKLVGSFWRTKRWVRRHISQSKTRKASLMNHCHSASRL